MMHEFLPTLMFLLWGVIMGTAALLVQNSYFRDRAKGDLQLFREVYGPEGKPAKPSTAEPQSPKQSAE